jgi:membrane protein required for colicin V production
MNFLDIIFLIPFCFFLIQGLRKGVIVEVFSILALLIAVIGSMTLTNSVLLRLESWTKSVITPYIIYVVVFIILFFLVILFAKLIEKILKTAKLNLFNRIAGAAFGAIKAIIIVSLLFWVTDQANILKETQKESSIFFNKIKPAAPIVISFITNNLSIAKDLTGQIEDYFSLIAEKI